MWLIIHAQYSFHCSSTKLDLKFNRFDRLTIFSEVILNYFCDIAFKVSVGVRILIKKIIDVIQQRFWVSNRRERKGLRLIQCERKGNT